MTCANVIERTPAWTVKGPAVERSVSGQSRQCAGGEAEAAALQDDVHALRATALALVQAHILPDDAAAAAAAAAQRAAPVWRDRGSARAPSRPSPGP